MLMLFGQDHNTLRSSDLFVDIRKYDKVTVYVFATDTHCLLIYYLIQLFIYFIIYLFVYLFIALFSYNILLLTFSFFLL